MAVEAVVLVPGITVLWTTASLAATRLAPVSITLQRGMGLLIHQLLRCHQPLLLLLLPQPFQLSDPLRLRQPWLQLRYPMWQLVSTLRNLR